MRENPAAPRREVPLAEARASILEQLRSHPAALRVQKLDYTEAAGHVLARELRAGSGLPPFARSTRDGYALRAADLDAALASRGGRLRLAGEIRAGGETIELPAESCIEIMTGAPLPAGADAVVMFEHARAEGGDIVFSRPARPGDNFVPAGQEAAAGSIVLPRWRRLHAAGAGLLASIGCVAPMVFDRPRVALLVTGDELVAPWQTPAGAQIRDANSALLAARVAACGAVPLPLPIARDHPGELATSLARGLAEADLLVISGGASAGRYDFTRAALEKLGAEFYFDAVRIRPGRPAVFGRARNAFFYCLPGNPVSALVTFELLVRPALAALSGEPPETWLRPFDLAELDSEFRGPALPLVSFVPVRSLAGGSRPRLAPLAYHGSGDLVAAAAADAFLLVPEGCDRIAAGSLVEMFWN